MSDTRDIIVLGGGIGGLAAALAFAQRGRAVTVLERAEAITEVGAGIQVSPNGLRVLEAFGLGEGFRAISVVGEAVSLRNYSDGREVVRLDLTQLARGQEYRFVHRADLIDLLAGAVRAAGVRIRLLQNAVAVAPGAPATVSLSTGDRVSARLVVGADGLHSVTRTALNGRTRPFFTRQVAWRAVVPNDMAHPPEARVHMGPRRHVVSYPLRGGRFINLVAVEERDDWVEEGWQHAGSSDALRQRFSGFAALAPLFARVEKVGVWGLFRHPVAKTWHAPGVALIGDAAHPTLPFLAQGANMALEDAWTLADCVSDDALPRYQALRRDRVSRVIAAANGNAWKYHLSNPLVRGVAHLGLGVVGRVAPDRLLRQFDWIYEHDVTQRS